VTGQDCSRVGYSRAVLTEAASAILLALADRERRGYEILQAVSREPRIGDGPGTSTLYRATRNLARAEIERLRRLLAAAEATSLVRRRTPGLAH
jgi:hypothetical protein